VFYRSAHTSVSEVYDIFVSTVGFVQSTGTSYLVMLDVKSKIHEVIVQEIYN